MTSHEDDFRADVERACDDARLSVTAIGSILIDEGYKWLALASAGEAGTAETVKLGSVHEHATAESGDAQTPVPSSRERK